MQHRIGPLLLPLLLSTLPLIFTACSDAIGPGGSDEDVMSYYFPLSKGSSWTYKGTFQEMTVSERDTTVNGKEYAVTLRPGSPSSLNRREGTTVYQYDPTTGSEYAILKEEEVGTLWAVEFMSPTGTPNRATFTVASYDSTRIVNGKKYHDVLHLQSRSEANFTGIWQAFSNGDLYFARGIGLIEQTYSGAGSAANMKLESFDVKGSSATAEATTEEQEEDLDGNASATVDGTTWSMPNVAVTESGSLYLVSARKEDRFQGISLVFTDLEPGTYQLVENGYPHAEITTFTTSSRSVSGQLVITENTEEYIKGTFSFDAKDGRKVRNGTFKAFRN